MRSENDNTEKRCIKLARYLVENSSTVRATAAEFGVSKSTVHKDLREKLKYADRELYGKAVAVLEKNRCERHIRGGIATKNKYLGIRKSGRVGPGK